MKKNLIFILVLMSALLSGCKKEPPVFDTPFVCITDETLTMNEYIVDKSANMLNVTLVVSLSASDHFFDAGDISVGYSAIPGSDLKEGVDYRIQTATTSPLIFKKGVYEMPIRFVWIKNPSFTDTGNNRLTVELNVSNVPEMVFGMPGPDSKKRKFTFIKK